METNADKILFRSSSVGYLMSSPKSAAAKAAGELSEGSKTHCLDVFVSAKYGRKEEITNKFLEKGNLREEDSITLLSRANKHLYFKNELHLANDFIKGTPDTFLGPDKTNILTAEEIIDIKTSWSAHTFFRATAKELEPLYYWQVMCYMALTGAKKATVAYCLVNGTYQAIFDEKRKLAWKMGIIDTATTDNEEYISKCRQIEINHIFDIEAFRKEYPHFEFHNTGEWLWDIPMQERVFTFTIDRDEEAIQRIYAQVIKARNYMNKNLFKIT